MSAKFSRLRRKIQRRRYRKRALLGDGNGLIRVSIGRVWVRVEAGMDGDGNTTYGIPTVVNSGTAGYPVYDGAGVWLKFDNNDELTIHAADERDMRAAGIDPQNANPMLPEKAFLTLNNVVRLLSRPTGQASTTSTLVYVNPLLYTDNYQDLNHYTGTPRVADKIDLASYIPTAGNHCIAVLFLRTVENTIQVCTSTVQAMTTALDLTDYQECFDAAKAETIPIQAYKLANGAAGIDIRDIGEDLRQFINMPQIHGFPNPVDRDTLIRAGQDVLHFGTLTITDTLTVAGKLTVIGY